MPRSRRRLTEITSEAHPARDLGRGWKVSPSVIIKAGETFTIADIRESGDIQQIWMTPTGSWRASILRIYWDGQEQPSVECPVGDFFGLPWNCYAPLVSLPVCVNPGSAFNCYWEMPFRQSCRITLSNIGREEMTLYYQVNYMLTTVPDDGAYFHAQFRRVNPLRCKSVFTLLDGVQGRGHYVGAVMGWGVNNSGWWGEGEIKFYLDGDEEWPTLCGTGTEDNFCGSYNVEHKETKQYQEYCTPYAGLHQVLRPDGVYRSQTRFVMYRWHVRDPVRFAQDLRVTIQPWAGGPTDGFCLCRTTSARLSIGIRPCQPRPSPPCPTGIISRSSDTCAGSRNSTVIEIRHA